MLHAALLKHDMANNNKSNGQAGGIPLIGKDSRREGGIAFVAGFGKEDVSGATHGNGIGSRAMSGEMGGDTHGKAQ
jgi:hypothetical protein